MQPQTLAKAAIHLDNFARLQANGCSVISNSDAIFGLRVDLISKLSADFVCSAGGVFKLPTARIAPRAVTNCPQLKDPLESRALPEAGACDFTDQTVQSNRLLSPGVYCGGLVVKGKARVTLSPGIYIMKNGPLRIAGSAKFEGDNVSFFFSGDGSTFEMTKNATINLSAMTEGPMAGLLMAEARDVKYSFDFDPLLYMSFKKDVRVHRISSNKAHKLIGTIYLPKSILMIDSKAQVAGASAYTAIVVGRLWLRQGPTLVLNANYSETDVPVPEGIGGDKITLAN